MMLGCIHADILFSERVLLSAVEVRIQLARASDGFCLVRAQWQFLSESDRDLFINKVSVLASIHLQHVAVLLRRNALYLLSCGDLKTYSRS